jgi:8-hydroxy-5-deazaflavin:NADPH oxidoreductase
MKIVIFGTGMVGQIIGAKLASLGHEVMLGTRDVEATLNREGSNGGLAFKDWHAQHPSIQLGTFADTAQHGEFLFNALSGFGVIDALTSAGANHLGSKVMIDISNPLDFSNGMPPSLFISNTDSLGEHIQREFPNLKVVKTLNTVNAILMVDPASLASADHTMFVCGNDDTAKASVIQYLKEWFGWKDVIDLGDITGARATEMLLPIWVRLWGNLGTPSFSLKVVR